MNGGLGQGFSAASWKRVAGEGLWVGASQGIGAVAGLAGVRLVTEIAPKEVVGEASLLLAALALGRGVMLGPVHHVQLRFHPEYAGREQLAWFTGRIARLCAIAGIALMAVALPACAAWSLSQGAGGVRPALLAAIAGVIGLDVARTWRLGLLSAERRQMLGALWSAADTSFVAFLPAAAMALFAPSSEAYLAGQVAGGLFALVLFGILFFPPQAQEQEAPSPEASRELLRRLVVFGLPFVGLAVMGWLSNLGERYVIGFMLSPADVGVYAAAYAIASRPVLMGGGIVFAVARPILFAAQAEQNRDKARRVFRLWMALAAIVGIGVVLLLWLFGDLVARLCLAESYRAQAREIFLWVATGHAALLVAQVIELRLLSYGRSAALLVPTCASGLLTIACSSVLLPRLGVVGAPAAKAGAFLVHLAAVAMMLRLARRDTRAEDVAMEAPPKGEAP